MKTKICMAFTLSFLSLPLLATDYYLIKDEAATQDYCSLDGRGSNNGNYSGWATTSTGTTKVQYDNSYGAVDPNGVYHMNGHILRGKPSSMTSYSFEGGELVFDGTNPAINDKMNNNSTLTIDNLRVVAGTHGEIRNGDNSHTKKLAGTWTIAEGGMFGLNMGDEVKSTRSFVCSAKVLGEGIFAATAGIGSNASANGSVTLDGDLSDFEGVLSAGEKGATYTGTHADAVKNHSLVIGDASSFPQATPNNVLLERSIVVTNGATISFTCDVTSPVNRGWDFGDGAQPTVNVDSGKTVTILGPVKGSVGFKKTGTGTLILNVGGEGSYDSITVGSEGVTAERLAKYVEACDDYIADEASADITWDVETNGGTMVVDDQTITTHVETKVPFDHAPVAPGMPTKTEGFFVGWNTDATASTGLDLSQISIVDDMTFYAIFADSIVRWFAEDGTTALNPAATGCAADVRPTHDAPVKPGTLYDRYTFQGWTPVSGGPTNTTAELPVVVAGSEVSYKAVYSVEHSDKPVLSFVGANHAVLLTVDEYSGDSTLENFPVLVRISESGIDGFHYADMRSSADGADLLFLDSDGNGLPFEIDTWNPAGESLVWVTLPELRAGTQFFMGWGSAATGKDACDGNSWTDYTGVWHMNDPGNGGATVCDSTTNALDGTAVATSQSKSDGKIGKARLITTYTDNKAGNPYDSGVTVDFSDSPAKIAAVDALVPEFTASFWVRPQSGPQWWYFISRRTADKEPGWGLQNGHESPTNDKASGFDSFRAYGNGEDELNCLKFYGVPALSKSAWTKLDAVWKRNGQFVLFTNGLEAVTGDLAEPAANPVGLTKLSLGGAMAPLSSANKNGRGVYGDMDEIRLRRGAVSADWAKADYDTQTSGTFLSAGEVACDELLGAFSVKQERPTSAVATMAVYLLGGADWADVKVEVAADAGFSDVLQTFEHTVDRTDARPLSIIGLSQGTTYYARASVSNNLDAILEFGPVSFTTPVSGRPEGEGYLSAVGCTTLSSELYLSSYGLGADSATVTLEASESDAFSTIAATATAGANLDKTIVSLSGLAENTPYYLRFVVQNEWNATTNVPLPAVVTKPLPFAVDGVSYAPNGDAFDFALEVADVYDGATCTATLSYNGVSVERSFSAAGNVAWTGVSAASGPATATVVVTTTSSGRPFSKTWTLPVDPGTSATVVPDVAAHASAVNALWMKPGDRAVLPELEGSAFYQVLNDRFASLDGNVLLALEPGIVGVRCVDANFVTNVMGVVILPDAIGSGSIYVFKESKRKNTDDWARSECWDKVENGTRAATNDSIPQNADDIAILPFYGHTGDLYIRHTDNISLGGLYAGMIRPDASVNCHLERFKDVAIKTVTFRRTDGQPVDVKTCPNSEGGNYSRIVLAGYDIDVVWASDAVIDGCSSETDLNGPRGRFYVKTGGSTNTLQNVTLTFQGYPGYQINGNGGTDTIKGVWKGTGTIVKKGFGGIAFDGDFSGFSGTIREVTGPSPGNLKDNAAGLLMRAAGASNVAAHVYGWPAYNHSTGAMEFNSLSRGLLGTGGYGVGPEKGAQAPAKGLYLHGGTYKAYAIDNASWGVGVKDEKAFDVLSVGAGFSYLTLQAANSNSGGKPINAVTAKTLAQTDKGTLVIYDPSCNNAPGSTVTNSMFTIESPERYTTGVAGDCLTSDAYPIIPWIVVNRASDYGTIEFAAFDANGRIVKAQWNNKEIDKANSENSNAYADNKHLDNGTTTDITVNSLYLGNSNYRKTLGAGRTLTITSGGLVLHGVGSGIGVAGGTENGSLVLGNATHPAYVYAKSFTGTNRIWSAVTAPGGFVKSWTGNLELGGDQTGIADEIAVNGGTLALGSVEYGITLADNLPIRVCAGAKLILPSGNAVAKNPLKIDGSAEAFGKVELPVNQTCASLAVRDVYESDEWTTLPSGTYGSSESAAEFVRDDLFVGPGVLTVGEAKARGVLFLVY